MDKQVLTKKDMKLLERVFAREIMGWSLQSKSKEYERLEKEGYVFLNSEVKHFKDGLPPMTIQGWNLTQWGHMIFCMNCKSEEII
jgi:hypothetical protein